MDYSGVITVAVAKDKFADTSGNKNNAFTITSGIDIAGEKLGTDGKVVDVVDPIWEKVSSSASAADQTATITVKGTDKYFKASSLNANLIKVFVDGKEVTTGITKTVGTSSPAYGSDKTTRIGDQYTITISGAGLTKNAKQINLLLNKLNHPDIDCYLHIDKKADFEEQVIHRENVFVLPREKRVSVKWAQISQVDATLNLLHMANGGGTITTG